MNGSPHLEMGYRLRGESRKQSRRVGSPPMNYKVRGEEELTISMAECEGLVLVTFARNENGQDC